MWDVLADYLALRVFQEIRATIVRRAFQLRRLREAFAESPPHPVSFSFGHIIPVISLRQKQPSQVRDPGLQSAEQLDTIMPTDNLHVAFAPEPVRAANDQLARASEQSELQERDWRLSVRREVHENLVGHLLRHDLPLDLLSESRVGDGLNPRIIPVITSRVEYHQVRNV